MLTEPLHPKAHRVVCASILLQSLPAVNHAGVLSRLAARGGNEVEKTRQDLGFSSFDNRGTLNTGAPADVAIMELREGTFEFLDNYKGTRTGRQRLFPAETVLAGKRVLHA